MLSQKFTIDIESPITYEASRSVFITPLDSYPTSRRKKKHKNTSNSMLKNKCHGKIAITLCK